MPPTYLVNLCLQLGILVLLLVGYGFFRMKKYLWHAQVMMVSFFMILASFLVAMLPSLLVNYSTFLDPSTVVFDTASIVHIPIGIAGFALGSYLVARWARNGFRTTNMKATWLMRSTMALWIASIAIGIVIYFTMPS